MCKNLSFTTGMHRASWASIHFELKLVEVPFLSMIVSELQSCRGLRVASSIAVKNEKVLQVGY